MSIHPSPPHTHHGKAARDGAGAAVSPVKMKSLVGAAEMAHPLRGLVALAEFPAPTQKSSQTSMTLVPEDPVPSLTSPGTGHAYDAQTL